VIVAQSLRKRYGATVALAGVSLQIGEGESVALIGTNGSGKTTLLRALTGLVRCEGEVLVSGVDVVRDPVRALKHVAYLPQVAPLLESRVSELVWAQAELRGFPIERVYELAGDFGLQMSSLRDKRFRDLSGGMRQKLLAALALSTPAQVLICDEPTANLDAPAREVLYRELRRRAPDSVLIVCSHRLPEVHQLVARVVELRDGRVARDERLSAGPASGPTGHISVTLAEGAARTAERLAELGFELGSDGSLHADVTAEHQALLMRLFATDPAGIVECRIRPDLNGSRRAHPQRERRLA
jgi:ABC-2 type transport system ATP-binding protein